MRALEDVTENEIEEAYNKGLNDAWELARKVSLDNYEGAYSVEELKNIFGFNSLQGVFRYCSIQEALAKLEAYAGIKVGDVVERMNFTELFVVSGFSKGTYTLINANGRCVCANVNQIKKTGKHIDIQKILEQIKENEHVGE